MSDHSPQDHALTAELNDLLQLDHDAVAAYTVAIDNLDAVDHRETLIAFREDHERHITELTELIRMRGGAPTERRHVTTGIFKAAAQQVGRMGGDRGIMTMFKANERQVRDKYRRYAEENRDVRVGEVVRRAAADEERHYRWAEQTVEAMGGPLGSVMEAVEAVHARTADAMESAERGVGKAAERMGRSR